MPDKVFLYEDAKEHLTDIATYTLAKWGEAKAESYIQDLHNVFSQWVDQPGLWRHLDIPDQGQINFMRHASHVVFFRQLSGGRIGIIAVLHQRMDFLRHLLPVLDHLDELSSPLVMCH